MLLIVSKLVFSFYFRNIAPCYVSVYSWEMTFLRVRMTFSGEVKIGQKPFIRYNFGVQTKETVDLISRAVSLPACHVGMMSEIFR